MMARGIQEDDESLNIIGDENLKGIDERRIEDVLQMGGDPFFLSNDDDEDHEKDDDSEIDSSETNTSMDEAMSALSTEDQLLFMTAAAAATERFATDGMGPSSSRQQNPIERNVDEKDDGGDFIWDGTIDEDAHFDLD